MMATPSAFHRAVQGSLAGALVQPAGRLPAPRPQTGPVSFPRGLPSQIPYGNQPPGLLQSSHFTGATAPNPVRPTGGEDIPNFDQPQYTAPTAPGQARAASPLIAALSPPMGLAPSATGATGGGTTASGGTTGSGGITAGPSRASGFVPPPPGTPASGVTAAGTGTTYTTPLGGTVNVGNPNITPLAQSLPWGALIAALATRGSKVQQF